MEAKSLHVHIINIVGFSSQGYLSNEEEGRKPSWLHSFDYTQGYPSSEEAGQTRALLPS